MTPYLERQIDVTARITRTDFFPYPVVFLVAAGALGLWQKSLSPGPMLDVARFLIWPLTLFLIYGASKRCRDVNLSPWFGVAAVLVPLGVLFLAVAPGSKGPNAYGADPREWRPAKATGEDEPADKAGSDPGV